MQGAEPGDGQPWPHVLHDGLRIVAAQAEALQHEATGAGAALS